MTDRQPSVLYVVYWGAAEPLGQALVLPSVEYLARAGVRITLVTFDKPADLGVPGAREAIARRLDAVGVRWIPMRYRKRPHFPAKLLDVSLGIVVTRHAALRDRYDIVHARTFVGGLMGRVAARATGAPLVYHNEGFYPDEQVDGGVWIAGSRRHRIARALERRLYDDAAGIVALSHRARRSIEAMPKVREGGTPVIVVPSTVDLERFSLRPATARADGGALRLVYIGSAGRRYLIERIAEFAAVAVRERPGTRFRALAREPGLVRAALTQACLPPDVWSIDSIPHSAMPAELVLHDAGLFFLAQGLSEHGCSPTKIGEYWACGLPVITTPNVSDTDDIIERRAVGVIVREHSPAGYRKALDELGELLRDPALPARCRRAAEEHYGLASACERQLELYRRVTA